jgi:hypothetical protein
MYPFSNTFTLIYKFYLNKSTTNLGRWPVTEAMRRGSDNEADGAKAAMRMTRMWGYDKADGAYAGYGAKYRRRADVVRFGACESGFVCDLRVRRDNRSRQLGWATRNLWRGPLRYFVGSRNTSGVEK